MEQCISCGSEYKNLALHWNRSSCDYPELSQRQRDLVTGVVMGDGSVVNPNTANNPTLHVKMINEEFLDWLDGELGWLSNGYTKVQTAEEAAKANRESGFSPNAKAENYHDKYVLRTKCLPVMSEWREWYSSGEKVFPSDIQLTPDVLKMWYVCDGYITDWNSIDITANNEEGNCDKIRQLFDGLGVDPVFHKSQRSWSIRFSQNESRVLFNYMGSAPPGFGYKWPNNQQT